MPGSPPSYAALAYWDDRFTTTPTPFDWLLPANALDGALVAALDEYELRRVQDSMHDGLLLDDPNVESGAERRQQPPCQQKQGERQRGRSSSMAEAAKDDEEGSSLQGKHLDFSEKAVELGRQREREVFIRGVEEDSGGKDELSKASDQTEIEKSRLKESSEVPIIASRIKEEDSKTGIGRSEENTMHWHSLDLLSLQSITSVLPFQHFDIIIDKSTSDSISCGADVLLSRDYLLSNPTPENASIPYTVEAREKIHPLILLALHLALLTSPGGKWICLSYSEERFPFFSSPCSGYMPPEAVPCPTRFWKLTSRWDISTPAPPVKAEQNTHPKEDSVSTTDGQTSGENSQSRKGKKKKKKKKKKKSDKSVRSDGMVVHRPDVKHWLYILERTDEKIAFNGVNWKH